MANPLLVDYPMIRMTNLKLMNLVGDSGVGLFPQGIRAKLALSHLEVPYEEVPLKVKDLVSDGLWSPEQFPLLMDGDRTTEGSWDLALYLERNFPDAPTLFGGMAGVGAAKLLHGFSLHIFEPFIMKKAFPYLGGHFNENEDWVLFSSHCSLLQSSLEIRDYGEGELYPLEKVLQEQAFIGGESPAYSDYIFASNFIWLEEISEDREDFFSEVTKNWICRCKKLYERSSLRAFSSWTE